MLEHNIFSWEGHQPSPIAKQGMPKSIIVYQQKISICKTDKLFLPIESTSNMNIIIHTRCYVYYYVPLFKYWFTHLIYVILSCRYRYLPSLPLLTHCEIMRRGQWQAQDQRSPPTSSSSSFTIIFFTKMTFSTPQCPVITKRCREGVQSKWAVIMRSKKDYPLYVCIIRKLGIHTM